MYVSQPLIRPDTIEARAYQVNITAACLESSTLVVLPTGMGKTVIAAMVIAGVLHKKGGKALFMAPTKPLVEQHANTLKGLMTTGPITMFTGELAPHERLNQWRDSSVVVSTPQVILNDLISGAMSLDDFNLVIYDEAHRATGNYAYVFIAEKYRAKDGLALGITASPGSTAEKILEVCSNLDIKRVEIRREYDPDVLPYVHDIRMVWRDVEVPADMKRVIGHLKEAFNKQVKALQGFGLLRKGERHSMRELLEAQKMIRQRMAQASPRPPQSLFYAATVQAAAVQINHALELIETQGTAALINYLDRIHEKATGRGASRAAGIVMKDEDVIKARYLASHFTGEHPKIEMVGKVVGGQLKRHPGSRIIVFTHYRDTSELVVARLEKVEDCRPVRFVGQATKGEDAGLSQKQQAELIEKFKKGVFNTLVATSVGEEGLDIPSTELVVFFEPVASEIRTIQRRGRTGRKMPGKVVILIAKGTRDEAYRWAAFNKEKRMMAELDLLRRKLAGSIAVGFPGTPDIETDFHAADAAPARPKEEACGNLPVEPATEEPGADGQQEPHGPVPVKEETPRQEGTDEAIRRRAIEILEGAGPAGDPDVPDAAGKQAQGASMEGAPARGGQRKLGDFQAEKEEPLTIIVDHREFNSGVVRELSRNGVKVVPMQLPVADFILSERVGVERKEVRDFVGSMLDGRLFSQLRDLRGAYMRPVLVVEGEGLLGISGVRDESIWGALASIVAGFGIPIISTRDDRQTAGILLAIARREHDEGRIPAVRGDKGAMSLPERQQFIVEGLPHVSGTISQRLLAELGSVRGVFNATVEELCKVKGVGRRTAEEIVRVLGSEYLSEAPRERAGPPRKDERVDVKEEE